MFVRKKKLRHYPEATRKELEAALASLVRLATKTGQSRLSQVGGCQARLMSLLKSRHRHFLYSFFLWYASKETKKGCAINPRTAAKHSCAVSPAASPCLLSTRACFRSASPASKGLMS